MNFLEHIGLSERGRLLRQYKEYKKERIKLKAVAAFAFVPAIIVLAGLYVVRELLNVVARVQKRYTDAKP